MTEWEGKTRGGILGYKIFVFFIKKLGLGFAYFFLYFVAAYFVLFSRKAYNSTYFYFRKIHHQPALKSFRSTYQNFCMLGRCLIDKIAILSGLKEKFTFTFDGEEHLRNMARDGQGGLLVNAHIGNWDIAGQLLERIDARIYVLMYDAEHRQIRQYLEGVLKEKRIEAILIREDMSHLAEIQKALSRHGIIAMNGDRYIDGNKLYTVDFMGKPAKFPAGPFSIAAKFGIPVTFAFAMKESKTHYHFYATAPTFTGSFKTLAEREDRLREMVQTYARELESKVRAYPLQWFNYYSFWNN